MKKAKRGQKPKQSKGDELALPPFDETVRRLFMIKQPGDGKNKDYVKANRQREQTK